MNNRYFKVVSPFRIWRQVGTSPSNSYVGSSRMITVVKEARNAIAGDEIHALVGGVFLVRGDQCWEIALGAPKDSPFEKSYGVYGPAELLSQQKDLVEELPGPSVKPDYGATRKAISGNRMRDLHPAVIEVEPSPDMLRLRELITGLVGELGLSAGDWKGSDINAYRGAMQTLTLDGNTCQLQIGAKGMIIVDMPDSIQPQVAPFEQSHSGRGRIYLRDTETAGMVAAELVREFVAQMSGPAPRL